jgi:hypothetical protein
VIGCYRHRPDDIDIAIARMMSASETGTTMS